MTINHNEKFLIRTVTAAKKYKKNRLCRLTKSNLVTYMILPQNNFNCFLNNPSWLIKKNLEALERFRIVRILRNKTPVCFIIRKLLSDSRTFNDFSNS